MECNRAAAEEDKSLVIFLSLSLQNELVANAQPPRTDPNTRQILESMRTGAINIKQAAEALGMEPAMLAYQLAGKVGPRVVFHFVLDILCSGHQ